MSDRPEADDETEDRFGDVINRLSEHVDRPSSEGDDENGTDGHEDGGEDASGDARAEGETGRESASTDRDELIVKSAVREHLEGMRVASAFYEPFDEKVDELVREAAERAEANGRKTVQARDL